MSPTTYAAGTVYLDVVPSFNNVQRTIRAASRGIGRDLADGIDDGLAEGDKGVAKAGKKSGDKYAGAFIDSLQKRLNDSMKRIGDVPVGVDVRGAERELAKLFRKIKAFGDLQIGVDIDGADALALARKYEKQLEAILKDQTVDIRIRTNAGAARRELERFREDVDRSVGPSKGAIQAERDRVKAARAALDEEKRLARERAAEERAANRERIDQARIGEALERNMARLSREFQRDRIRLAREAAAEERRIAQDRARSERDMLREAYRENDDFNRRRIAAAREAARAERDTSRNDNARDVGQAANAFRLFNGYLLTAIALGPLLIPILASIAAGMVGLALSIMGVVIAVGVMVAAFAGIGNALSAMSGLDKERRKQSSGSSALKATDTRGLRDAQLALARAREDSGRQIAAAADRQARAERSLTRAVEDAADAQRDLVRARQEAAEQLEDQNLRLQQGLLDEQMAGYRIEEAGYRLNNVLEDDQATGREKEIARIEYEQEILAVKQLQTENRRLERDVAAANQAGVEGSEQVIAAKEQIVSANAGVLDAERDLADAQADVARARIEEARNIADAERRVADALVDLQQKSVAAGVAGSAAMDAYNEAMRGLSPTAQAFAVWLYGLKPLLDELRFTAQEGFLPGLQSGMQTLIDSYGPEFISFVGDIAKLLGDLFKAGSDALTAPFWRSFFETMARYAPIFIQQFASVSGSLLEMIAGVLKAFAPFSAEIGEAFVRIAGAMADWGKNLSGTEGFASFLDYLRESGPKVFQLLENILLIALKFAIGMAPYADQLLDFMLGFTGWLASLEPGQVAMLIGAIGAIIGFVQVGAGLLTIISSVMLLASGGAIVGWVLGIVGAIGAIAGLVAGLVVAYRENETFARIVDDVAARVRVAFEAVGAVATWLYENIIQPVFSAIGAIISWWWENITKPVFDFFVAIIGTVGAALGWWYQNIVKPTFEFLGGLFNVFWQVVSTVFNMIYQIIMFVVVPVFRALYEKYIKPPMEAIGQVIRNVWEQYIKPVFDLLASVIETYVAPAFQRGIDAIARIWNTLLDIAKTPVRFLVETVLNGGIIDNFNKLAKVFPGMTPVDHVQLPKGFATGGILPGYTPGRDVHRFISPTGGMLDLSGGEAILRPEATSALGADWVNAVNAAARRGGTRGVMGFLGGFADGGILGTLGRVGSGITDAISGAAGFVSDLVADPVGSLRGVVERLVGSDNQGIFQLAAAVPFKILEGIGNFWKNITGGQEAAPGALGAGTPGMGWQAMQAIVRSAFPGVQITSAYRPGAITAVGTPSYHGAGRALDMTPSMALFNWLSASFPDSRELFYSPAGPAQILNGRRNPKLAPVTVRDHYSHVHWAYEQGGIIPNLYDTGGYLSPGLSVVANKTGKPEQIFTAEQSAALKSLAARGAQSVGAGDVHVHGDVYGDDQIIRKLADRIETRQRDHIAMLNLDQIGVSQ